MSDFLIRSTALLAVAGYAGRVLIDVAGKRDDGGQRLARIFWTVGCVALLIHLVCAFQFQHGWSHAAAWEHTRRRTLALTGWDSGSGLWANYGVTALWLVDAIAWQRSLSWPRHRVWYWTMQSALAFLMFNATAVFGPLYWRPIVAVFTLAMFGIIVSNNRNASAKRR